MMRNKDIIIRIIAFVLLFLAVMMIFGGIFTPLSFVQFVFGGLFLVWISLVLIYVSKGHMTSHYRVGSFEERIRQIESLKSDGLITLEEYEAKREQIMNESW